MPSNKYRRQQFPGRIRRKRDAKAQTFYATPPLARYLERQAKRARMSKSKFILLLISKGIESIQARGGVVGPIQPGVIGVKQGRIPETGQANVPKIPKKIKTPKFK